MAIELPKNRLNIRQIQTQQRKVPLEQILAVEGQNPLATGVETFGNVLSQTIAKRAELQRQGQELAMAKANELEKFNREAGLKREMAAGEATLKRELAAEKLNSGGGRGGAGGYFVPRGVDPESGKPLYSNSKQPGLFFDDMTPYTGNAPGKLVLQTLPSEQIEQEVKMDTLSLALNKVKDSYSDDFVGPVAARVGKAKQYIEPLANEKAANFYSNIQDLRNQLVYLRSGKAINEEEYKRLLDAIPNENTAPLNKRRSSSCSKCKNSIIRLNCSISRWGSAT